MTGPNWRDPKQYPTRDSLDGPGFAWEFLRRNPDFQADQQRLGQAARRGELTAEDAAHFAKRWGVRFRERLRRGRRQGDGGDLDSGGAPVRREAERSTTL